MFWDDPATGTRFSRVPNNASEPFRPPSGPGTPPLESQSEQTIAFGSPVHVLRWLFGDDAANNFLTHVFEVAGNPATNCQADLIELAAENLVNQIIGTLVCAGPQLPPGFDVLQVTESRFNTPGIVELSWPNAGVSDVLFYQRRVNTAIHDAGFDGGVMFNGERNSVNLINNSGASFSGASNLDVFADGFESGDTSSWTCTPQ